MGFFLLRFLITKVHQYAANNPVKYIDFNGDSTVVVISGVAKGSLKTTNGKKEYAAYELSVYQDMGIEEYNALKECGELPQPSYRTFVGRDAHYTKKNGETVGHSDKRYGTNNETPPGTYYLFKKGTNGDSNDGKFDLYVGDAMGSRVINGPDGQRKGIAIHDWDPRFSEGCFTLFTNPDENSGVPALINAIPDLNISCEPVRLILEPRSVRKVNIGGQKLWQGTVECEY